MAIPNDKRIASKVKVGCLDVVSTAETTLYSTLSKHHDVGWKNLKSFTSSAQPELREFQSKAGAARFQACLLHPCYLPVE